MKFQPKTDWKYDDIPTEADFNRIEQGIADALEGNDPIIQQDTPPDGVKEGRLWLDTSDDTYQGTAFESLEGEIGGHLRDEEKHVTPEERTKWNEKLSASDIVDASTTQKGIVQLNDTLTSTSKIQALTANMGKAINDRITSSQSTVVGDLVISSFATGGLYHELIHDPSFNGVWRDMVKFKITAPGTLRVAYTIAGGTWDGINPISYSFRLYVNGLERGIERIINGDTKSYVEDITNLKVGDVLSLMGKVNYYPNSTPGLRVSNIFLSKDGGANKI